MLSYVFLFMFLTIQWGLIFYDQFVYIIYILIFHCFFLQHWVIRSLYKLRILNMGVPDIGKDEKQMTYFQKLILEL